MKLDMRYGHHPEDVKHYDTDTLRRHFLVEKIFVTGELTLTYTHVDRVVFGGATPTTQALALVGGKEFGTPNFLDRRELGVVNVGATGTVSAGGETWTLARGDVLYLGMGSGPVTFAGEGRFYLVSAPAHRNFPSRLVQKFQRMAQPSSFTRAPAASKAMRASRGMAARAASPGAKAAIRPGSAICATRGPRSVASRTWASRPR